MAANEGVCPIESNIKSTDNGYNNSNDDTNMYEDNEFDAEFEDQFQDSNDAEFDAEDGDAIMNNDEDWDSIDSNNINGDGQTIIPVSIPPVLLAANQENPYGEGNEAAIAAGARPQIGNDKNGGDPKQKCWICDVCNGINNLLESLKKYNYKCCICSYPYHTNATIIFSNDWDGCDENKNEKIYTVWNCPFCTLKNDINWNKCDGCDNRKPGGSQCEISYSYVKPKQLNGGNGNGNHGNNGQNFANNYDKHKQQNFGQNNIQKNERKIVKKKPVRKPMIGNIGVPKTILEYPKREALGDCETRLSDVFGMPFRNKCLLKNRTWTVDNTVMHARIEWSSHSNGAKKFVKEDIVGRGFAINSKSGYIATMSSNYIWIFAPFGSLEFRLMSRYEFKAEQQLRNEDINNSRIRFVNNNVYVWSFSRARVYNFKFYENSLILVDVIKDKYFKDSQTLDVAVTDNLLILLFDRWCGVYKLYPKFEWFHAVAFATKSVNCFSLEIVNFDSETPDPIIAEPKHNKHIGFGNGIMNKFRKRKSEEKKDDSFHKSTNQNYFFINSESQIIGIHPTNPTFEFLHIASDAKHGKCKYCVSKRFGVFYLSNNGKELYQSQKLATQSCHKLLSLSNSKYLSDKYYPIEDFHDLILRQGIERFCGLNFDEQFGVSGRLLLFCETKKKEYVIHQMFDQSELSALSDELSRVDYYLMPGVDSDRKPFNLVIFVYEYLYGQDFIETILQSEVSNPALLKIKKQQQNEMENYQKNVEKDFLMIGNGNVSVEDMEIEYPKEGGM